MAVKAYRITPSLGPDLMTVVKKDRAWYDPAGKSAAGAGQAMTPQTGTTVEGSDGRRWMWVQVGTQISADATNETEVAVTDAGIGADPRYTIAGGSGGWYVMSKADNGGIGTLAVGDRLWIAKGTAA